MGLAFAGQAKASNGEEITTIASRKRPNSITSQTFEDNPQTDIIRLHFDKRR